VNITAAVRMCYTMASAASPDRLFPRAGPTRCRRQVGQLADYATPSPGLRDDVHRRKASVPSTRTARPQQPLRRRDREAPNTSADRRIITTSAPTALMRSIATRAPPVPGGCLRDTAVDAIRITSAYDGMHWFQRQADVDRFAAPPQPRHVETRITSTSGTPRPRLHKTQEQHDANRAPRLRHEQRRDFRDVRLGCNHARCPP